MACPATNYRKKKKSFLKEAVLGQSHAQAIGKAHRKVWLAPHKNDIFLRFSIPVSFSGWPHASSTQTLGLWSRRPRLARQSRTAWVDGDVWMWQVYCLSDICQVPKYTNIFCLYLYVYTQQIPEPCRTSICFIHTKSANSKPENPKSLRRKVVFHKYFERCLVEENTHVPLPRRCPCVYIIYVYTSYRYIHSI